MLPEILKHTRVNNMSVTFHNSNFRRVLSEPLEIETLLAELLQNEEITFFITRPTKEELHITCTKNGAVAIYANYNDPYVAVDASKTPIWESKKVNMLMGGESTPLYANIVIPRRDAQAIAKGFCASGAILSVVYWLKEGTEPR